MIMNKNKKSTKKHKKKVKNNNNNNKIRSQNSEIRQKQPNNIIDENSLKYL